MQGLWMIYLNGESFIYMTPPKWRESQKKELDFPKLRSLNIASTKLIIKLRVRYNFT